jgi:hypothetical protein
MDFGLIGERSWRISEPASSKSWWSRHPRDVAVLLRGARRVELLELEPPVDDRLEQVERADRVRHHRLVGPVPRLADVRLRTEVEDVRPVGRLLQLPDEVVHGRLVREVREVDL